MEKGENSRGWACQEGLVRGIELELDREGHEDAERVSVEDSWSGLWYEKGEETGGAETSSQPL